MSLLQLWRALCAILSSIIWQRLLLLSKEFFIRRLSKNGESSTSPQCYKASKFSLHISKQKWHRKLKNPVHCILFFSPRSINAVSPACLSSLSHFRIVSNVKLWKWKWKSEMLLLISKPINTVVAPRSPTQKESKKDLYLFFSILLRE